MKDDKICFSRTFTYLVLLVAVAFGAFWVMNYANTQKLGANPRAFAPAPISNNKRYAFIDSDNVVQKASGSWANGECEYRLRSYTEGRKTFTENAYTGFKSNGTNLVESTDCYPYIYGKRDLLFQAVNCQAIYNEYCRERTNLNGMTKIGGYFYSYVDGVDNQISQYTSAPKTLSGKTGKWWVNNIDGKFTSKMINTAVRKTFEGFPAYLAGDNTTFTPAPKITRCSYNNANVEYNGLGVVKDQYQFKTVGQTTQVTKDHEYDVVQEDGDGNAGTIRLTTIKCIPNASGVANVVSWRSKSSTATDADAFKKQTCQDNAEFPYTVTIGGTPTTKITKFRCKYGKGKNAQSIEYGTYIMDGASAAVFGTAANPYTLKCDCDGSSNYPTLIELGG